MEHRENQDTESAGKKSGRKIVRVLKNKYFIVSVLFLVLILFVDRNNVLRWCRDLVTVVRQEKAIRQYKKDIEVLDGQLRELSSDKDSLEKFAREQYYFQKEGEEVFIVD